MALQFEIIVISLKKSAARRAQAAAQLDASGFDWKFLDAVDGGDLNEFPAEYDREAQLRNYGYDLNPGQLGCFLSHREAWKKCVASQKLTLVLEDDFEFQQKLSDVLPLVEQFLPEFDMLRLQGTEPQWKYKVLRIYGENQLVKHYYDPFG